MKKKNKDLVIRAYCLTEIISYELLHACNPEVPIGDTVFSYFFFKSKKNVLDFTVSLRMSLIMYFY